MQLAPHRLCAIVILTSLIAQFGCGSRERIEKGVLLSTNSDSALRLRAVTLLEGSKEDLAVKSLRSLAADDDTQVRGRAILALGASKDQGAVNLLIDALDDRREWRHCERHFFAYCLKSEMICVTAHDALVKITGRNVTFDPAWSREDKATAIEKWRAIASQTN